MARITDSLHDYLNVLNYMYIATENKTIASCDVAYSDINCVVIKSYRQQIVNMIRAEIIEQLACMEACDDDQIEE